MFEGMDIPWVSALKPIEQQQHQQPAPADSIYTFGPAAFELVRRILTRALAAFPEAAQAVGEAFRENGRALFNAGLPQSPTHNYHQPQSFGT